MSQSVLALVILGIMSFFFVTRRIPLGITAVLGAIAMAAAGIITFDEVFTSFSSDAVMLVIGMLVVGNTLTDTGCADIIGRTIMRIPGIKKNEWLFTMTILTIVAILSGFISNTATVAIFLPLVASIAKTSGGVISKKNNYMAVGIASILGGNITLVGSTPQIVAQGILAQSEGCESLNFFDLTKGAIPLLITMLVFFLTVGRLLQKKQFDFAEPICDVKINPLDIDKKKAVLAGVIFLFSIAGFLGEFASVGTVAVIAACACIGLGCTTIEKAAEAMDWTPVLVLGGSLGFSKGLEKSGALLMLSNGMLKILGHSATPFAIFVAILILTAVIGNFMSSTATAAIMVPIAITVAMELGSNPLTFAIGIIIACSLSIATPVSTPPLAMTLPGGYRFGDYVIVGGLLSVLCIAVASVTLPLLYGL